MATIESPDPATARDHARIVRALDYLVRHAEAQPTLHELAREIGLSPYHLQRLFTRWAGISPKRFLQHLSLERAKESLSRSASVLEAAFEAGLSGPGRLHDLFVRHEAMTPGEWKRHGAGLELRYGWHSSPFGDCLVIVAPRGLCGLGFALDSGRTATRDDLLTQLGEARHIEDQTATAPYAARIFAGAGGDLRLMLRGTPFQLKVWQALMRIPPGQVMSYEALAASIGRPGAARAVAGAVARNPVAWVVPCHRVIRASGAVAGYRWGPERKRVMLALEAAAREGGATSPWESVPRALGSQSSTAPQAMK